MDEKAKRYLKRIASECSKRECCEFDIRIKLLRQDIEECDIDEIITTLQKHSLLDEERYAIAYAKDKFRFNGWGCSKIAAMLSAKKISDNSIKTALQEIDRESYKEKCLALIKNKARSTKAKDIFELKNKLLRYALGRGFDYETSLQALSELTLQANP